MSYQQRFKASCTPLGKVYRNYNVAPSDRVFYGDFQYRLSFEGNMFHYDVVFLQDLYKTIQDETFYYRLQTTSKNINVYVHSKDVLDKIIDQYQHTDYLTNITAPIDEEHLTGLLDSDTEYVFRNKYWYGKYPIKISFYKSYGSESNLGKDIREFIEGSFGEYRLHDNYTDNWYQNYLWVTQEEYDKGYPFLKLSYGDYIDKVQKVRLMEI